MKKEVSIALVSRIDKLKKSIDIVLDYFNHASKNNNQFKFYVIGGGNLLDEYIENNYNDKIIFEGEVVNIENRYKELDVVFGMASTMIQSMACNCISVMIGDLGILGVINSENIKNFSFYHFNVHNDLGKKHYEIDKELSYYLSNRQKLSFYREYVERNYSVKIGVDKLLKFISFDYKRDTIIKTLYLIIKKIRILDFLKGSKNDKNNYY